MTKHKNKQMLIAFDLDGTLIDSVFDLTDAVNKAMQSLARDLVSIDQVRCWLGNGATNLVARALSQNIQIDQNLNQDLVLDARIKFDQNYAICGHHKTVLYPFVRETLVQLKSEGYRLALITNKPSQFIEDILNSHSIKDLFDDLIGGDTFEQLKPNPISIEYLMDKYSIERKNMILVGDSTNDILTAKNASITSIALPYGYNHGESIELSDPDYIIKDLSGIHAILEAYH